MADESLLAILSEIRGKTLLLLRGVGDAEARWSPPGLQNHILWHAGHAYILNEWLPRRALGEPPQAPEGWFEMFGWNSRPAAVADDAWPTLSEVVQKLTEQYHRLKTTIERLSAEQLSAPAEDGGGRPLRYFFIHALHDEACHQGEVWLLRKMHQVR